jgi:tRNA pseudouridine55 synthase
VDLDGVLLINKNVGRTSFETVNQVKKRLGARKAGHAGTLDKSASGLLLVCLNGATSVQELLMGQFKRYRGTVRFGIETETLDRYGRVVTTGVAGCFSDMELQEVLRGFRGSITQVPPQFSAIHQDGERLYRKALRGEQVPVRPRAVEIREITLVQNIPGGAVIEVVASKGTYVRSLARDIAAALGTCGYLSQLHRLSVGPFSVEQAVRIDEIDEGAPVIPLHDALHMYPHLELSPETVVRVRNGMPVHHLLEQFHLYRFRAMDTSVSAIGRT